MIKIEAGNGKVTTEVDFYTEVELCIDWVAMVKCSYETIKEKHPDVARVIKRIVDNDLSDILDDKMSKAMAEQAKENLNELDELLEAIEELQNLLNCLRNHDDDEEEEE